MSTFEVKVVRVRSVEPIEGADLIEVATVGDYRSVVMKGDFKAGDLAVYIPEASVLPEWLIEKMGLTGKLAGTAKNRVKAIKLRGCVSQGLILKLEIINHEKAVLEYLKADCKQKMDRITVWEGDKVTSYLGIVKYEPIIPANMRGDVYNAGTDITVNFDIENVKKFPDVLEIGEEVVMTEKIHGTFCGVGILPEKDWNDKHYDRKFVVFSKGQGAQGLCLTGSERSLRTVYFRALLGINMFDKLEEFVGWYASEMNVILEEPLFVLGEVYGGGIQSGFQYGSAEVKFRAFDICSGYLHGLRYYNQDQFELFCDDYLHIDRVPVLYRGPFFKEVMLTFSQGVETVSGNQQHMREGVVVRPVQERYDDELGRVILKSLSDEYILRKGGTEYN